MAEPQLRAVPRPRQVELQDPAIRIDPPFVLAADPAAGEICSLLQTLLERETNERVVRGDGGDPDVRLVVADSPPTDLGTPPASAVDAVDRADASADVVDPTDATADTAGDPDESAWYELDATGDHVAIRAGTLEGLRYGCQTLVTALDRCDGQWAFPGGTIHDWPATAWRGFMLDPARGFLPVEQVKRRIDQAARAKLNRLHLHLLDDESYALESAAFPELNRDADGNQCPAYSPDDVAALVEYAAHRGIEIVPELDVPAHARHVLAVRPDLRCTVEDGEPSDRSICIGSADTLAFLETLIAEVIALFPFEVVHLGGDEWEMLGHSWDECTVCRERMAADGSETVTEHFYAFVRRLHGVLAEHDRRLMLWNDQIDISSSPDIPRDVLIQFWRVAGPDRGPVEGCSMARFLEEGFDVVNSYVHAAYVMGWITDDYLLGWAPRRRPTVPDGREAQVQGGELLAWEPDSEERRAFFERALPSAIPTFADRLWNPEPVGSDGSNADRTSFSRAVTRHALGPFTPVDFDVYEQLGWLTPPSNWRRSVDDPPADADRSLPGHAPDEAASEYESTIETLSTLRDADELVYPETATAYVDAFEWLLEVADCEDRGVIDRP